MADKLKPGFHRCVARDGTVAAMIVGKDGRIVEFMTVGKSDPPPRPRRRWMHPSLHGWLQERRLERERRLWLELAEARWLPDRQPGA